MQPHLYQLLTAPTVCSPPLVGKWVNFMWLLHKEICVEKLRELSGHPFGTILSQASLWEEGATIIHDSGVDCKLLTVEARRVLPGDAGDYDMIWSAEKSVAACNGAGEEVAIHSEHNAGFCSCTYTFRDEYLMMLLCSEMNIEEPLELLEHPMWAISSEASKEERPTTIRGSGVGCKRLTSEAGGVLTGDAEDYEIVSTAQQCVDAGKAAGLDVAVQAEDLIDQGRGKSTCRTRLRCVNSGTFIEKSVSKTPLIAETSSSDYPQRSHLRVERSTTSPSDVECKPVALETGGILPSEVEDREIVCSAWEHVAVHKRTKMRVASCLEHIGWLGLRSVRIRHDRNPNSKQHRRPSEHRSQWYPSVGSMRSTQLETIDNKHRVNCGNIQTGQSAAKPGLCQEGSSTIPTGSTIKRLEAHDPQTRKGVGDEMVTSAWEHVAACNDAGQGVASLIEDYVPTNRHRHLSSNSGRSWWWCFRRTRKRRGAGSHEQRKWFSVNIGTLMEKSMLQTSLIAGKSSKSMGQSAAKPSVDGRFNDQSFTRTAKRWEKGSILAGNAEDGDMVCTALNSKGAAVLDVRTGRGIANPIEHCGYVPEESCGSTWKQHILHSVGVRWAYRSVEQLRRRSCNNARVSLTPLQSAMIAEKFREFSGTLRDETILSEAWSEDQERATTIPGMGVHNKRLVVEARNTSHRGKDIVSSAWQQVAAHDGAVLNVAIESEEIDYKSVIEIA